MVSLWYQRALRSPEIISKFTRSAALSLKEDDVIFCSYLSKCQVGRNWGDKLNPVLVSMISGKRPLNVHEFYNVYGIPIYIVIGSGLGHLTHSGSIVWGQGFANYHDQLRVRPRKICAVRGPLSRQKILEAGLDCPDVVGDPAFLLPRYFDESITKQHRIGLIPHFSHLALPQFTRLRDQGAEIIDITGNVFDVVRLVKSCHMVASSSLHGLIMADAYGVPSKWLRLEEHPIGDGFKFHDYLESIGRSYTEPFTLDENSKLADIESSHESYAVNIDIEKLYESCPFRPVDFQTGQAKDQRAAGCAERFSSTDGAAQSRAGRAYA